LSAIEIDPLKGPSTLRERSLADQAARRLSRREWSRRRPGPRQRQQVCRTVKASLLSKSSCAIQNQVLPYCTEARVLSGGVGMLFLS
jgi:hypothetical protein